MTRQEITAALNFRHACKIFDETRKISDEDFAFILEAGRLSPSSFGMEHWRFLVITNQELKKSLKPHCWNQAQIDTCSHLVVVLAKTADVSDDGYVSAMFSRRGLPKEATDAYLERYKGKLAELPSIFEWSARQTYIASANMTAVAAMIGIDSCFIEGFSKEEVEKVLGIDTTREEVALILPFGYRLKPQPAKLRLATSEIAQFIH